MSCYGNHAKILYYNQGGGISKITRRRQIYKASHPSVHVIILLSNLLLLGGEVGRNQSVEE
jgi:hypothetical protein